jgi:7-cyano-7-deazaguanine synthase in queuosine biosynthesis
MKKVVILNSGGLDSLVMVKMAEILGYDVTKIYFDIGHDYNWKEKQALEDDTQVFDMSWFAAKGVDKEGNGMNNIFIPGRNLMFAVLAACKFLPDEIWLGALLGEIHQHATDKNETFRTLVNDVLSYTLAPFKKDVKLVYPFVDAGMDKLDVVKLAVELGYSKEVVESSSCMSGKHLKCGTCGVCLRRAGIFMQTGLSEEYEVNPWTAEENRKIIRDIVDAEITNDDSHYDFHRRRELIPALKLIYQGDTLEQIRDRYSI